VARCCQELREAILPSDAIVASRLLFACCAPRGSARITHDRSGNQKMSLCALAQFPFPCFPLTWHACQGISSILPFLSSEEVFPRGTRFYLARLHLSRMQLDRSYLARPRRAGNEKRRITVLVHKGRDINVLGGLDDNDAPCDICPVNVRIARAG